MRVTNNLYILSGGNYSAGDYSTMGNVFAFRTPKGLILVDSGLPEKGLKMINETLEYYGIEEPVTHVLLTHSHIDHAGNAKYYQEKNAIIVAGKGDVDYLCEAGGFSMFGDASYSEHEYAYQKFPAFTPDIAIEEDTELVFNGIKFKFITIPGHTVGSLAIFTEFEGKRILFTGDSFYPMGMSCEQVDNGWRGDPRYDNQAYLKSLTKLCNLVECDMVLAGHGNICVRNGTRVVRNAARTAYHVLRF